MAEARLKQRYREQILPALVERFGYSTPMQAPRIEKVTVNMGVGDAKQDSKVLEAATEQLATITGQRPNIRRARKSIAQFKVREGMPVGVAVTLRGERSYEFLDRLMSVAIPRIRDFRGLSPRAFDGRGNYSLGVREQIIFPEIDYDAIDEVRGMNITITTSAASDLEAFALLLALGLPFAAQGHPAGFDGNGSGGAQSASAEAPGKPQADAATADEPPGAPQAGAEEPSAAADLAVAGEPAAGGEPEQAADAEAGQAADAEGGQAADAEAGQAADAEAGQAADAEAGQAA
ncbi:MAG: 50S ribosomal protein L5, partial [Acidobacteria bacterium]|nr:50S ribosomal protein L5 [Acidobacteriota bacterium]